MKTNKISTLILFIALSLFLSCNSKSGESGSEAGTKTEKEAKKGKYGIKAGTVVYTTTMMGMEVKQTLTFDDFGEKEVQDVEMEMMGYQVHSRTLVKDGFIYSLDMVQKTGTKTAGNNLNASGIDFENLSDEMSQKMNLKKEGTEEFLDRKCEVMTIDYTEMSMKGSFLVYKGIPLKMNTEVSGMEVNLEAIEFTENPDLPADIFDLPADITIAE